ncbi:MAG: GNAT family N-acetyltransferase [Phycisphaerae bacterium]
MSYASIEITEVGEPEFPLIQVLRDTIFGAYGHRHSSPFAEQAEGKPDLIALIAHLEGNPVGYKVGYRENPGLFYSWTGGVLPDYRTFGVARRMQDYQHGLLRGRGYRAVAFSTFNKFREMLLFGLSTGFVPVGVDLKPENEIAIKFRKDLTRPDPERPAPSTPASDLHVESVSPIFHGQIAALSSAAGDPATEEQVDAEMAHPGSLALLAYISGKPVGFAVARPELPELPLSGATPYAIRLLGVDSANPLRGVGSALMARLIETARQARCASVRVGVRHDRVPALRMLIKSGFDVLGVMHHDSPRGPTVVHLELPIGSARQ